MGEKDSFRCSRCLRQVQDGSRETDKVRDAVIGADKIEAVDRFCYQRDIIDRKRDAEAAVARIRSG